MDKEQLLAEIRFFIGKYYKPEHSEISDMQMASSASRVRPALFKRKGSRKLSSEAPEYSKSDDADDVLIQTEDAGYRCEEDESHRFESFESKCLFSAAAPVH